MHCSDFLKMGNIFFTSLVCNGTINSVLFKFSCIAMKFFLAHITIDYSAAASKFEPYNSIKIGNLFPESH